MKIYIKSGLYGASKARGTGVVIDVFRASSTICAILAGGAKHIVPVKLLKEAYQLKEDNPSYLLIGERQGLEPKGFDYGNSPHKISKANVNNRIVIFTSSAGSQAIIETQKSQADELLIGSFVNARAIVDYIKGQKRTEVSLIAVGTIELGRHRKATEDQLCAQYIKSLLQGKKSDFSRIVKEIKMSDGANRLRKLGQIEDFKICLSLNLYDDIVPEVVREKNVTKTTRIVSRR